MHRQHWSRGVLRGARKAASKLGYSVCLYDGLEATTTDQTACDKISQRYSKRDLQWLFPEPNRTLYIYPKTQRVFFPTKEFPKARPSDSHKRSYPTEKQPEVCPNF